MIRLMEQADIPSVIRFVRKTFETDTTYNERQKLLLSQYATYQKFFEMLVSGYTVIFEDDAKRIVGIGSTQGNILRALFVDPLEQGKGIGKALLDNLEQHIATEHAFHGKDRIIQLHSTESALPFYEKHGYVMLHRIDERLSDGNTTVPRFLIQKNLA